MDPKQLVDELFSLDENIRWVGIVDEARRILANVQRPGVNSLTSETVDEMTLREFPTVMGLFWRELIGQSGKLNAVAVSYSRVYILAFYVEDLLVVLSFEPKGMSGVARKLEARFGSLLPTA
jgi:hypothetical protein